MYYSQPNEKIMRNISGYFLFAAIFLSTAACRTKPAEAQSDAVADSLAGKKVTLPQELYAYAPFKDSLLMDSAAMAAARVKIYSMVNLSCPSCIGALEEWRELIPELAPKHVPVIIIGVSDDQFASIHYLFESGKLKPFPYPLLLDKKNNFPKLNGFYPGNTTHMAVMTDENNKVLVSGDPRSSEETRKRYLSAIDKIK